MLDRKKKFYFDIISSIDLIEQFTIGVELFAQYKLDKKTKSAVERQLSIIGEAIKKIKEIDPEEVISNQSGIIGFRNRIVHAYDSIDDEMVWAIIKRHLPPLKMEIAKKLGAK